MQVEFLRDEIQFLRGLVKSPEVFSTGEEPISEVHELVPVTRKTMKQVRRELEQKHKSQESLRSSVVHEVDSVPVPTVVVR